LGTAGLLAPLIVGDRSGDRGEDRQGRASIDR
jgi:hypothetical protein